MTAAVLVREGIHSLLRDFVKCISYNSSESLSFNTDIPVAESKEVATVMTSIFVMLISSPIASMMAGLVKSSRCSQL